MKRATIFAAVGVAVAAIGISVAPSAAADTANCQQVGAATICGQGNVRGGAQYVGPSGPAAGPSNPASGPSGPAAGPSGPAAGPCGGAAGPSGGCSNVYGAYQNCNVGH